MKNPEAVLKWSGFVLVSLAAIFLVSTAIERGWIGPELQLLGAVAAGSGLVGIGIVDKLRIPWRVPAIASGLVVLFASCGAAWGWLGLVPAEAAGISAIFVGALGLYLAHRDQSPPLAALSFTGLLAIPVWADLHHIVASPAVMAYLVLLSLSAALLYLLNRWVVLWSGSVLAFGYLAIVLASEVFGSQAFGSQSALAQVHSPVVVWMTVGAAAVMALVHWFVLVLFGLDTRSSAESDPALAFAGHDVRLALAIPVWFLIFLGMALQGLETVPSHAFAIGSWVAAIFCFGSALGVRRFTSELLFTSQCAAAAIAFSIALLVVADGVYLPFVLMLQGVAMLLFVDAVDDELFSIQALLLIVVGALGGFGFTLEALFEDPALASDLVSLADLCLFVLAAAWLYARGAHQDEAVCCLGVAYVWLFIWVSSLAIHWDQGQAWISGCWALIALVTVAGGVRLMSPPVLRLGLAALSLTVIKLLSVDLAAVDTFWRVGLFFLVGVCLLVVGYRMPRLIELSLRSASLGSDATDPGAGSIPGQSAVPTPES